MKISAEKFNELRNKYGIPLVKMREEYAKVKFLRGLETANNFEELRAVMVEYFKVPCNDLTDEFYKIIDEEE